MENRSVFRALLKSWLGQSHVCLPEADFMLWVLLQRMAWKNWPIMTSHDFPITTNFHEFWFSVLYATFLLYLSDWLFDWLAVVKICRAFLMSCAVGLRGRASVSQQALLVTAITIVKTISTKVKNSAVLRYCAYWFIHTYIFESYENGYKSV